VDKFLLDSSFPQGHSLYVEAIGDILKNMPEAKLPKPAKLPPKLTRSGEKLIQAAVEIRTDPDAIERAYMARQLVQCTLPHSDPGKVERWIRRNGNFSLVLQAGWNTEKDCSFGYPYGSLPRLLLFWVITEAVQTQKRRLQLGNSLAAFMRDVGLDPYTGGGKRGDAKRLRSQMEKLFRCRISFDQKLTDEKGHQGNRWLDMQISSKGELWWDIKEPEQGALWHSWLELGEDFFECVTSAPVPADKRALRALKQSPLALDLYAWATYRVFSVNRKKAPQFIPWDGLQTQMGSEYGDAKNFKKKAQMALRKVRSVYPSLKISPARGGFILHPGRTAVPTLA
jgi:hypothetical protein